MTLIDHLTRVTWLISSQPSTYRAVHARRANWPQLLKTITMQMRTTLGGSQKRGRGLEVNCRWLCFECCVGNKGFSQSCKKNVFRKKICVTWTNKLCLIRKAWRLSRTFLEPTTGSSCRNLLRDDVRPCRAYEE